VFQHLYRLACDDKRVRLWLAFRQGQVQAGAIVLYQGQNVLYWLGASLEQHGQVSPNVYLHYRIIADAVLHGYTVYDLGRSGSEGVRRFKLEYGATSVPAHSVCFENRIVSGILAGVQRLRSLCWQPRRG
jgi:CelD/BcsL family acetyltransferase involved in cellulose biosynthesis